MNCIPELLADGRWQCAVCKSDPRPVPAGFALAQISRPCPGEPAPGPCKHLGQVIRQEVCKLCGDRERFEPVMACAVYGECTARRFKSGSSPACCLGCPEFEANEPLPADA